MANQIIPGVQIKLFYTAKSLPLRLHPLVQSSELCNNSFSGFILNKSIGIFIIGHFLTMQRISGN